MEYYFNGELLAPENIEKARQDFINNQKACIKAAITGKDKVNDLEDYIKWREGMIKKYEENDYTMNFTFLQNAYFFQTGECIGFLPKTK
jgi:hypothetical protein